MYLLGNAVPPPIYTSTPHHIHTYVEVHNYCVMFSPSLSDFYTLIRNFLQLGSLFLALAESQMPRLYDSVCVCAHSYEDCWDRMSFSYILNRVY